MRERDTGYLWDTSDELRFISRLGCHATSMSCVLGTSADGKPITVSRDKRMPRAYTRRALAGYIEGSERRERWGDVDGQTALASARDRLARIRGER